MTFQPLLKSGSSDEKSEIFLIIIFLRMYTNSLCYTLHISRKYYKPFFRDSH